MSSCFFGVGGLLIVKYINPILFDLFNLINSSLFIFLVIIFMFLALTDFCISFNIIQKLKVSAEAVRKDYTEEISKKVKKVLMDKSIGFKRLLKAFPNIKFSFKGKR